MTDAEVDGLTARQHAAVTALAGDLQRVFGGRLLSIVAYGFSAAARGEPLHSLALVDRCTFDDLAACAREARGWQGAGLAVPLVLERQEFLRSLDAFPFEYGGIIDDHVVILGASPFAGVTIAEIDYRRACERQAKSHLIHLREGLIEAGGDPGEIFQVVRASSAPFRMLLMRIARLTGVPAATSMSDDQLASFAEGTIGVSPGIVREVLSTGAAYDAIADPTATLAPYMTASAQVWSYVDGWQRT